MNFSAKSNIYETNAVSMRELFDDFISGDRNALVVVVSSSMLAEEAQTAIKKSVAALGYGEQCCMFVVLSAGDATLGQQEVMSLIEGLDPLILVATDKQAANAVSAAYRAPLELNSIVRIFGRTAATFESIEALLNTPEGKQKAWAVLKKLPKLD